MAELVIEGQDLVLRLTTFEKVAALHRDLRFPLSSVSAIDVAEKPFTLVRGFRAAGMSIPKRVAIGTFRRMAVTRFFVLKGTGPAVHITFSRGGINEWVIGDANAAAQAERLRTDTGR